MTAKAKEGKKFIPQESSYFSRGDKGWSWGVGWGGEVLHGSGVIHANTNGFSRHGIVVEMILLIQI